MAILILRPNSDIQTTNFSKSPGSQANFYSLVNEANQDGDTTHIYTHEDNSELILGCELPSIDGQIVSVTAYVVCAVDGYSFISGGVNATFGFYINGEKRVGSYSFRSESYNEASTSANSFTGITNLSDITDLRISLGTFDGNTNKQYIKCTQMYVNIEYNEIITSHNVTVNATNVSHNIPETVESGGTLVGTFIPDEGYSLPENITVTMGEEVVPDSNYNYNSSSGNFSMNNITDNVSISIISNIQTFTIATSAGIGGTITPTSMVEYGGSITISITPNAGYIINDVMVDNVSQGKINSYTFNDVKENHTVNATFVVDTTPVKGSVVVRIDRDMNLLLRQEIIESNNIRIDKYGNFYTSEFIEDSSTMTIDKEMNLRIFEIKEVQNLGSN